MSHPFDLNCIHTPACPSWWCCERRGSYEDAKARYADAKEPRNPHDRMGRHIGTAHEDYVAALGYDPRQGDLKEQK